MRVAAFTAAVIGGAAAFLWRYGLDVGPVLAVAGLCAVLAGTHAAAILWVVRTRPGPVAATLSQTPYVIAYALLLAWWLREIPLAAVAWSTAATAGVAWPVAWYLHRPRTRRRMGVLAAVMAGVLTVNGGGLAAHLWQSTGAFGFQGQATPWGTVNALTATSCLFDSDYYWRNGKVVSAECPSGPTADYFAGSYDKAAFDDLLCTEQPRAAFQRWWEWNKQYQVTFRLQLENGDTFVDAKRVGPPFPGNGDEAPAKVDGSTSKATVLVRIDRVSGEDLTKDPGVRVDKMEETWDVTLQSVSLGGWKVCQINIADPIKLRAK